MRTCSSMADGRMESRFQRPCGVWARLQGDDRLSDPSSWHRSMSSGTPTVAQDWWLEPRSIQTLLPGITKW